MESEIITISEIFFKIKNALRLIIRNWWLIFLTGFFTAILFFKITPEREYVAKTTFLIKGSKPGGGLLNFASKFGVNGSDQIDFNKVSAISKSEKIRLKLLEKKAKVKGKKDFLSNHLITEYNFNDVWKEKKPNFLKVDFTKNYDLKDSVNRVLLKKLDELIQINETNEGVIEIIVYTKSSGLSYEINTQLSKMIEDYFFDFELKDEIKTARVLKNKTDSLKTEIKITEDIYAQQKDRSTKTIRFEGLKDLNRLQRDLELLNRLFIELYTQYEMVNFKILEKESSFEILDKPIRPLEVKGSGPIIYSLIGCLLGIVSCISLILISASIKKLNATVK